MSESEKENILKFPFNIWMAPNVGPLPLIGSVNRHSGDLKIYSENELSWEQFGVGSDVFDALTKSARECRAAIRSRFEEANAKIKLILDGKNMDEVADLPILPKTPGKAKKRCTRKITQEHIRRSTRQQSKQLSTVLEYKPKLSNSDEISDAVQSLGLNKPKHKRKSKKKPTTSSKPTCLRKHETDSSASSSEKSPAEAMNESTAEDTQTSPKVQHLIEYHENAIHNIQDSNPKSAADIAEMPIIIQEVKSVTPDIASTKDVEETTKTRLTSSRKSESTTNPRVLGGLAAKRRSSRKSLRLKAIACKEAIKQCTIKETKENEASIVIDDADTRDTRPSEIEGITTAGDNDAEEIRRHSQDNIGDTQSSEMEGIATAGDNDAEEIEVEPERRQTRQMTSQKRESTRNSRVLVGLAAKRRSSRKSLHVQTAACKQAIIKSSPVQEDEENASSSDTIDATDQPSSSTKEVKLRTGLRSGNSKRTRENCELDTDSTKSSPKQKRFRKMPRTVSFINRSTTASRNRRTPAPSTPLSSRNRFCSPLRTPTSNINSTIKSFLVRNTPDKVDQQAALEAKKKKIEEKEQKDAERKRRIEEERKEKIAQAAKKRKSRLRRAAKYRQEQWQTKLQKQLDKFEKQDLKVKQDQLKAKEEQEEQLRKIKQQEAEKAKDAARKKEEMKKEQEQKFKKDQEMLKKAKEEQEQLKKIKQQEKERAKEAARKRAEMKKEQELKLMRENELIKEKEREIEAARQREEMKKAQELKLMRENEMKKAKQEKEEHLKKVKAATERIMQLQSQNPSTSKDDSVNYDMTPKGPHRVLAPSSDENYNIDDYGSGDSTDDEDRPKKKVPKWARGPYLQAAIIKQYKNPPNLDEVFRGLLVPVVLEDVFMKSKPRYFKRTSSAQWNSPIMPHSHISFTENTKGF